MSTALYAYACFRQHGSIKTEQTCTQRLQTFHRVKPHKGSPMKVVNLYMPGCDEICNLPEGFDPRPEEFRNHPGYKYWFQNVCLSFKGISKTPIFQTFPPANMTRFDIDHDHLQYQGSFECLQQLNVTKISEEEARILNMKTADQALALQEVMYYIFVISILI